MTERRLWPVEVDDACARFADAYTAWTWPELLEAVTGSLSRPPAAELVQALLDAHPVEPPDPARALREALHPWTDPSGPPAALYPEPPSGDLVTVPEGLPTLRSPAEVATWLDLTTGELEWFADHGGWLRRARPPLRHYRHRTREKRDGVRVIEAPKPRLREIQRRVLHRLLARIPAHPCAQGFLPGTGPAAFGRPHAARAPVLRVDLRHCFESIPVRRVRDVFGLAGYPPPVAEVLADLCTTATPVDALRAVPADHAAYLRGRHLPQGAPTSPHLSNLVLRRLDRRLYGYAAANGLTYTRYGDDLALSGDDLDAGRALWVMLRVIRSEGFTVHAGKTRVMHSCQRQTLAGLVVNDRPRVPRAEYDALRALLHNARLHGAASQNHAGHPHYRAHVLGRIAWVGTGDPARRATLLRMAREVDWEN